MPIRHPHGNTNKTNSSLKLMSYKDGGCYKKKDTKTEV